MKGRPPIPKETKILKGTFQKCREPDNPAVYAEIDDIPPPGSLLSGPGIAKWYEAAAVLMDAKVLKLADLDALEQYCLCWENIKAAQEELRDNLVIQGVDGSWKKNPAHTVLGQQQLEFRQWSVLLGLNPSSRGRMTTGGERSDEPKPTGFGELRGFPPGTTAAKPTPGSLNK